MNRFRISKYDPKFRTSNGIYLKSEWTSYGDIGRKYQGNIFTKEEYIDMENKYCEILCDISHFLDIDTFVVKEAEMYHMISEVSELLNSKGLFLSENHIEILNNIRNDLWVDIDEFEDYIKLLLRECFWCRLETLKGEYSIEFGYDYYVYVNCEYINDDILKKATDYGLFIEKM